MSYYEIPNNADKPFDFKIMPRGHGKRYALEMVRSKTLMNKWIKILHGMSPMPDDVRKEAYEDRKAMFNNIKILGWTHYHSVLIKELTYIIKGV